MAKVGHNFSPKDFSCWVIQEGTAGTSAAAGSGMYALNVDSVSYPSLNPNQALDVRTGGRFLRDDDFYQDNKLRTVELSLSGVWHNDVGHKSLLQNICAHTNTATDITLAATYSPPEVIYGTSYTDTECRTLTIAIAAPDLTSPANSTHLIFPGMMVSNFTMSADTGTDSGRYKWSATLVSGTSPTLDNTGDIGGTKYSNSTDCFFHTSSAHLVKGLEVVMNSFTVTLDNPVMGVGAKSTGYEQMVRGTEFAVTFDTQIKYDGNTKNLIQSFDDQTGATAADLFQFTNSGAYGIDIDNGVLTNVAYSEGEIMMLDVSGKASRDASDTAIIAFDSAS
jgi:hypothetical protein